MTSSNGEILFLGWVVKSERQKAFHILACWCICGVRRHKQQSTPYLIVYLLLGNVAWVSLQGRWWNQVVCCPPCAVSIVLWASSQCHYHSSGRPVLWVWMSRICAHHVAISAIGTCHTRCRNLRKVLGEMPEGCRYQVVCCPPCAVSNVLCASSQCHYHSLGRPLVWVWMHRICAHHVVTAFLERLRMRCY